MHNPTRQPLIGVGFDLGGTIAELLKPVLRSLWSDALNTHFSTADATVALGALECIEAEYWRRPATVVDPPNLASALLSRALDSAGVVATASDVACVVRSVEQRFASSVSPAREAHLVVDRLWNEGFRIGILSNIIFGDEVVWDWLREVNLHGISVVLTSKRLRIRKPNPTTFLTLAAELGVEPSQAVFIGDNCSEDGLGAVAAGMRSVVVDRSMASCGSGVTVVPTLRSAVDVL